MTKSFDDYVDHLIEFARKKGYRVSKRLVRNLLRAHFRQLYMRVEGKQDVYIHDFLLLIIRKDLFFKRRYISDEKYIEGVMRGVDTSTEPVYTLRDFDEDAEE